MPASSAIRSRGTYPLSSCLPPGLPRGFRLEFAGSSVGLLHPNGLAHTIQLTILAPLPQWSGFSRNDQGSAYAFLLMDLNTGILQLTFQPTDIDGQTFTFHYTPINTFPGPDWLPNFDDFPEPSPGYPAFASWLHLATYS